MKKKRWCKCGCNSIVIGHPNKRFCNKKHKDRYHNKTNPRGYYAHLHLGNISVEDEMHPNDPYSLGQE